MTRCTASAAPKQIDAKHLTEKLIRRLNGKLEAGARIMRSPSLGTVTSSSAPSTTSAHPSRANLVGWPFGAGGGEDLVGGVGQRVGGDVGVTGDDDGDLLQRA